MAKKVKNSLGKEVYAKFKENKFENPFVFF